MSKYARIMSMAIAAFVFVGCHKEVIPDIVYVAEEVPEVPLVLPDDPEHNVYAGLNRPFAVAGFYRSTNQRPGWVDNERTSAIGDSLVAFIRNARYYGLRPQKYHLAELTAAARIWWRPEVLLRRDVLLTDAFISLLSDLEFGQLSMHGDHLRAIASLNEVLAGGGLRTAIERHQPTALQYRALRQALETLLANADSAVRGPLMQGFTIDSLLVHRKVRTIEINLERWRSEREEWGQRYIFVNIPSFMVELIDQDRTVFDSRAIVGKRENATPEFSSMVQCFITYPYWHVPRKIAVGEFLPVIQRDTSFIRRNNFDVLDRKGNVLNPDSLDWRNFNKNNFPVALRQREGQENSLGVLKFVFDNPYAVFVHDTNAPRLFRVKMRALSHGCIRIERATALAHYLVTGQAGQRSALLESFLSQKIRHTVDLAKPIPIHIRYFTASTDRNGKLVFYEDIYEKDQQLIDQLYSDGLVLSKGIVGGE